MTHKDDDFLKQFRKDPPEAFGKRLYSELMRQEHKVNTNSRAETPILTPFGLASTPTMRRTYALPLVAAIVMTLLVSVALLMSVIRPQPNAIGLAQTDEGCTPDIPADWMPYTIQVGDTLASIVARQGYDESPAVELVIAGNCLDSEDAIAPMDMIYIPDHAVITAGNVGRLAELVRYGDGSLLYAEWRPGTDQYVVGGTQSLLFFEKNLSLIEQIPVDNGAERLAYSPDGAYLATTGGGNTVLLWDAETREILFTFKVMTEMRVADLAFSHDSHWLFAVSYDGNIALMTTDGEIRTNYTFDTYLFEVAAHPTSSVIITSTQNGIVRWGYDDTGALQRLNGIEAEGGQYYAQRLAFRPDGNVLATVQEGAVVLRHSSTLEEIRRFGSDLGSVHLLNFMQDSKTLLVGDFNKGMFYLNTEDGQRKEFFAQSATSAMDRLTFRAMVNPSEDRVVAVASNNTVIEYTIDFQDRMVVANEITKITPVNGWTQQVVPSPLPEQHLALVISGDGRGRLIDTSTGEAIAENVPIGPNGAAPFSAENVAFNPDGKTIAVLDAKKRKLRIYNLEAILAGQTSDQAIIKSETAIGYQSNARLQYTPDGRYLLINGNEFTLWDMQQGQPEIITDERVEKLRRYMQFITFQYTWTAVSPDGSMLAVSYDGPQHFYLLDFNTGDLIKKIEFKERISGQMGGQKRVMFTPDGEYLIIGGTSSAVIIDLEAGESVQELKVPNKQDSELFLKDYALSPDGKLLVTLGIDGPWMWNISNPGQIHEPKMLLDPDYSPYSVAFTPDGRRLLITTWTDDTLGILGIGE